jgi:hypothetical protein
MFFYNPKFLYQTPELLTWYNTYIESYSYPILVFFPSKLNRFELYIFFILKYSLKSLSICVSQVLSQNEGQNYVYGMLAFSFLEVGRMNDAEEAAKRGYEINKQDIWAQHAVG